MRTLNMMLVTGALSLYMPAALAKVADYVDVGKTSNQNLGTWAIGDGDQVVSQVLCTASANYDNAFRNAPRNLSPTAVREPYSFKVTDLASPGGYYLYLNGDDTNTGNARIQVWFEHRDTKQPVGFETLSDDVYDSHYHEGQFRNCANGDNSEIKMTLTSTELQKAKAGNYSGSFRVGAQGGSSGTAVSTSDFSVSISVASAVQVSGLSNVDLGSWTGVGDKIAEETFCVYSNGAAATYSISISSPNQDASANFFLVNPGATASIPYALQFKDSVAAGGGTTVAGTPLSGIGNNDLPGCGGIDNAKLTVTILATDMQSAPTDAYSDTITLVVVPQ
jgi:hypothetical protein